MALYPVLTMSDTVIFPNVIAPLFISRASSIRALDDADRSTRCVFVVAQRNASVENPGTDDIYSVGTICRLLQKIRLPDGNYKVVLEGAWRARAVNYSINELFINADVEKLFSINTEIDDSSEALRRSLLNEFEKYVKLNSKLPEELIKVSSDIYSPEIFTDVTASHSTFKVRDKQALLETLDVRERMKKLLSMLMRENDLLVLERKITDKVRSELDKGQRQYYLREKLKAIQDELGEGSPLSDADELRQKVKSAGMPEETEAKAMHEIDRYSRMAQLSPEATVARTYIDWLIGMPWKVSSRDQLDIKQDRKILEEDHYGLEEVKERIIEFLAVRRLAGDDMRAQVICFVGPPGVGKTSLGKSIARTMGRKFVNMSLGGMRDEAEIRGHRRTYVGALPGRIIQKIKQAGTNNPVLLMDEIDKIGSDFRGDPASALLEVLDPEQNCSFTDNFMEVPFDLSRVMFIITANNVSTIPTPLLDRMELIELPGYVEEEKIKIAQRHLIPRILKEHGLTENDILFPENTLLKIISQYTMEAGVRGLDRQLSKVARKVAARIAENNDVKRKKESITIKTLSAMLGAPKLHSTHIPKGDIAGAAIGLAWTEAGGDVLIIEASSMPGSGAVSFTGNLGSIMKESAETALAYLRSNAATYKLSAFKWQKHDIHIHVPEGAVPKEGPSAGITLALSLCSALTGRPVDPSYAMTGEMTLHGRVLPIGGLREKILAAKRYGIKKLILPEDNKNDVTELKSWVTKGIEIHYVSNISEVFALALKK